MTRDVRGFGLVVTTLGRVSELDHLLGSICVQTRLPAEVVLVDQNVDDRLAPLTARYQQRLPLTRLHRPTLRGATRGRNVGWRATSSPILLFPDDDCWYPPNFLSALADVFARTDAAFVAGRPTDETGRTINGRFAETPQEVTRANVWRTSIEWLTAFRREALEDAQGFRADMGPGAASPWKSGEVQDLMLRLLDAGWRGAYDPSLTAHHPEVNVSAPTDEDRRKAYGYAQGMGRVLRLNGCGASSVCYWAARPALRAAALAARFDMTRARYFFTIASGRLSGYRDTSPAAPLEAAPQPSLEPSSTASATLSNSEVGR